MSFRSLQKRFLEKLSCAPPLFFEIGPFLGLAFLLDAFPPLHKLVASWHGDFIFGVLGGISVIPLVFPRGRMDGMPGMMKAWGLGLFLTTVALSALPEFLSGFHSGLTGRDLKVFSESDPGQYFFILLLVSLLLGAAFYRMASHRREAERQRELASLAAQAALRSKLVPHFIFNALNTLHAQIEVDSKGAQATTERLADLFRQVVAVVTQPLIPLRQELAFVEAYLGIEQTRLGNRLSVSIQIPEELEGAQVPPLSLQVLVENAIKHGVTPLEQGGEVRIGAERENGALHLWVEDPGPGVSEQRGTGTALDTLRQRLERPEDLVMGMVDGRHRVGFLWRQS
jgi:hypothetical protein